MLKTSPFGTVNWNFPAARKAIGALGGYCDLAHRKDIEDFFREHRAPGAERTVRLALERISSCVEFKQKQGPEFEKWLAKQK